MWMLLVLWFGVQTPPEVENGVVTGMYYSEAACAQDAQRIIRQAPFWKQEEKTRVRLTCQYAPPSVLSDFASKMPA